jgi:hypothetical protein
MWQQQLPPAAAAAARPPLRPAQNPSTRPAARPRPQLVRFCDRTGRHRMLCLDRYADHTSRETWDYSAWIRAYGVFLDERLDAYRWGSGGGGRRRCRAARARA